MGSTHETAEWSITESPVSLLALPEDALGYLISHLDEADIFSVAITCTQLAHVCCTESMWRAFCMRIWPLLGCCSEVAVFPPVSWRQLHSDRCKKFPLGLASILDQSIHCAKCCSASSSVDGARVLQADQLASLLLGVRVLLGSSFPAAIHYDEVEAEGSTPPSNTERALQGWVQRLVCALSAEVVLQDLCMWARDIAASLDEWYDDVITTSTSMLRRRATLVRVLQARSALALIETEVLAGALDIETEVQPRYLEEYGQSGELPSSNASAAINLATRWTLLGLSAAVKEIDASIYSLELEGFNLTVPPSDCPSIELEGHWWWGCRVPLHCHGRLHGC